ncbi:Type III secretory pathway protein [gamma proteobacterium HdN1]|nr:Type III secretory pathway protein [gamma proteobacterium HdN1]
MIALETKFRRAKGMVFTVKNNKANRKGSVDKDAEMVILEFTGGVHSSAVQEIKKGRSFLLGTAEDCDLVVLDSGVKPHHCRFVVGSASFELQAVDGPLVWCGEDVLAGGRRSGLTKGVLQVGEASICVYGLDHERVPEKNIRRPFLWLVTTLLASSAAAYGMAVSWNSTVSYDSLVKNDEVVFDARISRGAQEKNGKGSEKWLESSVREVMRLSGFSVQTKSVRNGVVEVSGYFSDEEAVARAVMSRAMRDLAGLKKIRVVNRSPQKKPEHVDYGIDDGVSTSKNVQVIYGSDPYLVSGDGSLYYPGAKLPGGTELVSILDKKVVFVKTRDGDSRMVDVNSLFNSDKTTKGSNKND